MTPENYEADALCPRVARAVAELLNCGQPVSAPAVFVRMGMLSEKNLQAWRDGKVPYLERVIAGSLGKTNRVVRIIALHAHDLNLPPAPPHAAGPVKHKGRPLRFCKTGERRVEEAFKRVFSPRRPEWKRWASRSAFRPRSGGVPSNKRMELTSHGCDPGRCGRLAAHPRCSADKKETPSR